MPNQLINENSPYLHQHANNPVNWYPWGEEALQRARNEDKPIFLSIGYAACHWCHVMERESFEDEETAEIMNAHFINIKVDREERPDLDSIYMSATVAMTGSGGWPMSVFLTPDLQPFFAGTYFPPVSRYNLPSFKQVLLSITHAWREERDKLLLAGNQVTEYLRRAEESEMDAPQLTHDMLDTTADRLIQSYDWNNGGWGKAPKFPQPMALEFLMVRATHKQAKKPDQRNKYLDAVTHALQAMAQGGMYDVVGGGFARYSVDDEWLIPHFEKMLYDNAQLALAYLHSYVLTGEIKFREVCEATLDFILREMSHPSGGFYSSMDADSEGEEGKFYVWEYSEIRQVLAGEFEFFKTAYGLTPNGNWEGRTVLQRSLDEKTLAAKFASTENQISEQLEICHKKLLDYRNKRIRPATDKKILVSWNGLALAAFAEADRYLNRSDYLDAAKKNAQFILDSLYVDGLLLRSWYEGRAKHNAYLEDYASLVLALIALYQSDPNPIWYSTALQLADDMIEHYGDSTGNFYDIRNDHETLLIRPKDIQDNATPSGNSLAAFALLQLAAYGDRPEGRKIAENMLAGVMESAARYPTAFGKLLCAADFALGPTFEAAIIGALDSPEKKALIQSLWKTYRPRLVAAVSSFPPADASPALLRHRPMVDNLPTAYVCQNFTCGLPIHNPDQLEMNLHNG